MNERRCIDVSCDLGEEHGFFMDENCGLQVQSVRLEMDIHRKISR
jgi:hypothetical protein